MLRSLEIKILFCEIFDCTEIFRENMTLHVLIWQYVCNLEIVNCVRHWNSTKWTYINIISTSWCRHKTYKWNDNTIERERERERGCYYLTNKLLAIIWWTWHGFGRMLFYAVIWGTWLHCFSKILKGCFNGRLVLQWLRIVHRYLAICFYMLMRQTSFNGYGFSRIKKKNSPDL